MTISRIRAYLKKADENQQQWIVDDFDVYTYPYALLQLVDMIKDLRDTVYRYKKRQLARDLLQPIIGLKNISEACTTFFMTLVILFLKTQR